MMTKKKLKMPYEGAEKIMLRIYINKFCRVIKEGMRNVSSTRTECDLTAL